VTGGLAYDATARVVLAAGVITGVVAALPGIVDLLISVPGGGVERRATLIHAVLATLSLVAFGLAWALRGAAGSRPTAAALALEGVGTGVLLFGGRTGAALILEHHIGASPARDAGHESVERPAKIRSVSVRVRKSIARPARHWRGALSLPDLYGRWTRNEFQRRSGRSGSSRRPC
jgi:uncharacterized membrane protein